MKASLQQRRSSLRMLSGFSSRQAETIDYYMVGNMLPCFLEKCTAPVGTFVSVGIPSSCLSTFEAG